MSFSYMLGVWMGNLLVAVGVVFLALIVNFARQLARMRNVETGQPIPAEDFFVQMGSLFASALGLNSDGNQLETTLANRKKYGPVYVSWIGWNPLVFVCEPDAIHKLLRDKEMFQKDQIKSSAYSTLTRVMGTSLIGVSGEKWMAQRKAMDPAFQYKKMRTLVPLFVRCTRKLIAKWTDQSSRPILVEKGMTELTLDAIGLGAFGYDFGAVDGLKEMGENLEHYNTITAAVFSPLANIFPFVAKLPTAYNRMLDERINKFQAFLTHTIDAKRKGLIDGQEEDLLDHIITMSEEGQLSNEEIRHNLFLFFLAGHDTSSSALTAALYFLAKYPHMQKKVYDEVISVLGDEDEITLAHLSKLEYLNMFLKETLRMRSPVGATTARTVQKEGVVLSGYHLPKGTAVSASIWSYHYDERYWPNAYTFKPERWASTQSSKRDGLHDILTFSTGPRICIGKKFAMTEMLTVLAMMVQKFEFELVSPDYQWKFRPLGITLKPQDGLPLRVKLRPTPRTS